MIKRLTNQEQEVRRQNLKQEYMSRGITECELHWDYKWWKNSALSFAHKEKRIKYLSRPKDLWTFKETLLACIPCHQRIEGDRLLTLQLFKRLRNN